MIGKKVKGMLQRQKERKQDRSIATVEDDTVYKGGCFLCQNKFVKKCADTSISSYDNDPDIIEGIEAFLNCLENILFCPINYGLYCLDLNESQESSFADDNTASSASFSTSNKQEPAAAAADPTAYSARVASF